MRTRARVKRNESVTVDKLKDFITTLLLHISFYAFIISLVVLFMDHFG